MTNTTKILSKLRFPEFENDGEWKVVKFKDIFTILSSNTLSRAELSENDGLALNVHYGDVLIKFGERLDLNNDNLPHIKDDEILHKYKSSYLKDGDVIFADTAEDETAGKCTEIRNIGKRIVISGLHTIPCRPNNEFAPYYMGYYLNSNAYHTKLLPLMQGAKVTSISRSSIQETTVVYPLSLPEQQKIASFLTSLDEQISAHTKKLEALKAHKKGLMQQLFPANGEKTPKLRFPEFKNAGEWEDVRLGEIANVYQGYGFPDAMQGKKKGKYPFYKVSDISNTVNKGLYKIDIAINYVDDDDLPLLNNAKPIPSGTIIFAKIGEAIRLNRRVITTRESLIDNNTAGVKAKNAEINDMFLFYIMTMIDLMKFAGGVVPAVKKSIIENIQIIIPKITEQQKIASFLSSIDDMIKAQGEKIQKLKTYKNGLMQQMFPQNK